MKSLTQHLGDYAAYHRDRRNVATHFFGIPMIVFAVQILTSRPAFDLAGWRITPAAILSGLTIFYYLRLDRRLGLAMALLLGVGLIGGDGIASLSRSAWLGWGIGLLVVGWILQLIGHLFEGRKPAFLDDITGLIIGPLFVVVEAGFLLGLRRDLRKRIEITSPESHN